VTRDGWEVEQRTDYPWKGLVELHVRRAGKGALRLRIPGWADRARLEVAGEQVQVTPGTYAVLQRDWQADDVVRLELGLRPVAVHAHPRLAEARGSVAVRRGPLIYCVESADNPGVDLLQVGVGPAALDAATATHVPGLLDGVTVLDLEGFVPRQLDGPLYRWGNAPGDEQPVRLRAIPYFAWANRGPTSMSVWLRR
jgi:DUF1680 family protein